MAYMSRHSHPGSFTSLTGGHHDACNPVIPFHSSPQNPFNLAFVAARFLLPCQRRASTYVLVLSGFLPFIPDFTMVIWMLLDSPQSSWSRGISVYSFLGRGKERPTYSFAGRKREMWWSGVLFSQPATYNIRGEALLLAGYRLVLNTQHLCWIQTHLISTMLHL